jgi:hypothetical protein
MGCVGFLFLIGLSIFSCIETLILVDMDGALRVIDFFEIGFGIG